MAAAPLLPTRARALASLGVLLAVVRPMLTVHRPLRARARQSPALAAGCLLFPSTCATATLVAPLLLLLLLQAVVVMLLLCCHLELET